MAKNSSLNAASVAKQDEFYTHGARVDIQRQIIVRCCARTVIVKRLININLKLWEKQ